MKPTTRTPRDQIATMTSPADSAPATMTTDETTTDKINTGKVRTRGALLIAGFHVIIVALLALYSYARTLPPTPVPMPRPQHAESAWWGFWPITYVPDLFFTGGLILAIAALVWVWYMAWSGYPLLDREKAAVAPPHAPRPRGVPWWIVLTGALYLIAFYLFPIVHTRWGDAYILSRAISWPDPALRLTHTWQAPLDVALHSWVWHWLHAPLGWENALPVYHLLSPIAGLLYLIGVAGLARDARFAPGWLTFGLLMTLGLIQQFFGYIENYSFIIAGMMIYLWLAVETLRGERALWQPALVLAITHALHPSSIVLAPTLLVCGWFVAQQRCPGLTPAQAFFSARGRATALPLIGAIAWPMLLVFGATLAMMEMGNHGFLALFTHDQPGGSDGSWFVPLFEASSRWEHYTMFSWLHLRDYLNDKVLSGPVVLWSLLWIGLARLLGRLPPIAHRQPAHTPGADRPTATGSASTDGAPTDNTSNTANTPAAHETQIYDFLLLSAVLYLLFVWVWNPDYGGQRDWDLFSPAAVPSTVLLCYLLPRALQTQWRLFMAAAPMILLQALVTAAWIYQNTLPWEWP